MIRGHWGGIENRQHWVGDMTLDKDRCTISRGHVPYNLAGLPQRRLELAVEPGRRQHCCRNLQLHTELSFFAVFGFVECAESEETVG